MDKKLNISIIFKYSSPFEANHNELLPSCRLGQNETQQQQIRTAFLIFSFLSLIMMMMMMMRGKKKKRRDTTSNNNSKEKKNSIQGASEKST